MKKASGKKKSSSDGPRKWQTGSSATPSTGGSGPGASSQDVSHAYYPGDRESKKS